MIELTETMADNKRSVWIAPWNVLRLREDRNGTIITMIDDQHVRVTEDPKTVARLCELKMKAIYQTPDYRE